MLATIKRQTITGIGEDVGRLYIVGRIMKLCSYNGKKTSTFSIIKCRIAI
jgi:hypothetical protein